MRPPFICVFVFIVFHLSVDNVDAAFECAQRRYSTGIVCVCNSTYCDTIDPVQQVRPSQYIAYVTNEEGLRLNKIHGRFETITNADYVLTMDSSMTYQTILGWGGAFTDSFGINYYNLSKPTRRKLLRSYFSKKGSEYNLCRVPIGGTDFSTRLYSYAEEEDPSLRNFKLAYEDYKYKISLIRTASSMTNGTLRIMAASWSAPTWMKTTGEYFIGFLKKEYYQVWANYILKFLEAYSREQIQFWGITTGNEPSLQTSPIKPIIPMTEWTPSGMRKWIANNLGPTIRNSQFAELKIIAVDDLISQYPQVAEYLVEDKKAAEYIDGFGLHWYLNTHYNKDRLYQTHEAIPNKFILADEACPGSLGTDAQASQVILGKWSRGVSYATDIVEDINNFVVGWLDWNMALDTEGGPVLLPEDAVDSPIIVNAEEDEFYKNPTFYALAHFSKFVPVGSIRINISYSESDLLMSTAFRRPDNGNVVVLINRNDSDIRVAINDKSRGTINLEVTANSFTTILYW